MHALLELYAQKKLQILSKICLKHAALNQEMNKHKEASPVFSFQLYQTQYCVPVLGNCGTDRGSYAAPGCGTTLAGMC